MEFTGLIDKGGKEIYEGDVFAIQAKNEFGPVEMKKFAVTYCAHEGNWALSQTPDDPEAPHFVMTHRVHRLDVLGNIYQNPELLKK